MLKGHVFSKQLFGNPIFALFVNTFLNGNNGVSDNYKNGMAVTYSGTNVTISSGAVCIQGRFLEEDTSTTISAGTVTAYCKLVIEIDLDKTNTESDFQQGAYKVIKGVSAYPNLTQTNIVKNNAGIYQYELARFQASANGISNFQDMRTFLDFNSIYTAIQTEYRSMLEQLEEELEDVEDGSAYVLKNDYAVITGSMIVTASPNPGNQYAQSSKNISYPSGYNNTNCVCVSFGTTRDNRANQYSYDGSEGIGSVSSVYVTGNLPKGLHLGNDNMILNISSIGSSDVTINYKIVLMKIS